MPSASSPAIMDLGWINAHNQSLIFQASATIWPSSTKAETLACLTTIFTARPISKVELYTDSQVTIQGFHHSLCPKYSTIRKWKKSLNYPIWLAFNHIIQILHLDLHWTKVKAHNDDHLNTIADCLAKEAINSPIVSIDYTTISTLHLMLQYNHFTIKESSHHTIKQIQASHQLYQFLHLERNLPLLMLSESQHITWPSTFNMLNYNHTEHDRDSTSFGQHRQRNFKFKIFSNELLTLSLLKVWQPDLYFSDICLLCHNS